MLSISRMMSRIRRRGMNGGKRRKRYFRRNIFRFALKMEEKENGRNVDTIKVNYRGIFPSKVIVVDSKSFRLEHCVELFPLFLPPPKQINVIFSFEEKKVEWGERGGGGIFENQNRRKLKGGEEKCVSTFVTTSSKRIGGGFSFSSDSSVGVATLVTKRLSIEDNPLNTVQSNPVFGTIAFIVHRSGNHVMRSFFRSNNCSALISR